MVGHSEDGFCTKPTAHGNRQQRWGGAGVRSGKHRRLGGTATTATGDSRRSTGNAANRSAGASRVLFFVGEAARSCCRCCWAAAPVPRVLEKQQVVVLRHATRGQPPEPGQDRAAERHGNVLPSAPENVGSPCCCHREPASRAGGGPRPTALDTTTTAARAARGDGRQPRREHRHRWRPPAAPTHENKSGGQLPATSPTASAISFLPTVQQRGRVGHLQSPSHRTISWKGVYQEESPISHFGGPEAGQFTITPFLCRYRKERRISSAITLSRSP